MIDTRTAPYAALLLRVSLGVLFLAHGLLLKVFTFTIPGTVAFFQSVGYPGFFAYLMIAGEIGGGIALLLGVWTRPISLLLLPIMIGATLQHVGTAGFLPARMAAGNFRRSGLSRLSCRLCSATARSRCARRAM